MIDKNQKKPAESTKSSNNPKIRLGVSTCLLGERVRYDVGHRLDRYLVNTLSLCVDWVRVCPEVEMGLSTPRESMWLVGDPEAPRLIRTFAVVAQPDSPYATPPARAHWRH
jgi:uncharacterized protein YbbK (DUF523 family)